jgi:hypothetical protein
MRLKHSDPLESKLSCCIIIIYRGHVNEDVDSSHYMKDFYA